MLRVAILSDTHGHLDERVASLVADCDYAVHAGDIGARGVLDDLKPRRAVVFVRGNNDTVDKWHASEADWLETVPWHATLELPGGCLIVEHGHRAGRPAHRHATLRARYPRARLIVYGHSHHLCVDREVRPWVVNPGAAGDSRTFGGPSCCVLSASQQRWVVRERRFEPLPRSGRRRWR